MGHLKAADAAFTVEDEALAWDHYAQAWAFISDGAGHQLYKRHESAQVQQHPNCPWRLFHYAASAELEAVRAVSELGPLARRMDELASGAVDCPTGLYSGTAGMPSGSQAAAEPARSALFVGSRSGQDVRFVAVQIGQS